MTETRTVRLVGIQYDGRMSYLSVCGRDQLEAFVEHGSMNCYDATSAPKEYLVKITVDFDDLDQVIDEAKRVAEEELGLTIKTFRLVY